MNIALRLSLSSVCIFGAILFANSINDVESNVLSSAVIALLYQVILIAIGAISYFLFPNLSFWKTENNDEIETQSEEPDDQPSAFDIEEILTNESEVIGVFGGSNIYDKIKIRFSNGFETFYKFDNVIKFENINNFDSSNIQAGSLVIEPGIVYVPDK